MAWSIGMNDTSMGDGESVAGPPEADHHNNFDFIRFVAASFVLISHSYPLLGRSDEPFKAFVGYETGGEIAVAIFFVISGYLVTGSFLRSRSIGDYIRKRSLRLLPALFIVVVLSAFVLGPILSTLSLRDYVLHPQTWYYLRNCVLYTGYHLPGVFAENPYPVGALHVGIFVRLAFLITLSWAVVSWYWVEKPALAWKTRTLRPWGPRRPVSV